MTSHQVDITSRRIWLGLTIPGKKMMRMRDPTWSTGMPELSVDEIVQQA